MPCRAVFEDTPAMGYCVVEQSVNDLARIAMHSYGEGMSSVSRAQAGAGVVEAKYAHTWNWQVHVRKLDHSDRSHTSGA